MKTKIEAINDLAARYHTGGIVPARVQTKLWKLCRELGIDMAEAIDNAAIAA